MKQEKGEEGRSWYGGVALLLPGKPPRRWLLLLGDSRFAGGGREQGSHCCWVPWGRKAGCCYGGYSPVEEEHVSSDLPVVWYAGSCCFLLWAVREREFREGKRRRRGGRRDSCEWGKEYSQPYPILLYYLSIYLDSSSCEAQSRTHLRMLTHFNKK